MRSTLWAAEVQCTAAVRIQELGRRRWKVAGVGMITSWEVMMEVADVGVILVGGDFEVADGRVIIFRGDVGGG